MENKTVLTIRDIIQLTPWKKVKRAIKFHYPKDRNDYEDVFERICKAPKQKVEKGEFLRVYGGIDIRSKWFKKYGEKFLEDVKKGDEEIYYSIDIKKEGDSMPWSISFIKWNYLVNIPIGPDTLKHYTLEDILAHFIWEITYYGNEKEIAKVAKEIGERVKKAEEKIAKKQ